MNHADFVLLAIVGAVLGLAAFATQFVGALWQGRPLQALPIGAAVGLTLLAVQALGPADASPRQLLVAAATENRPPCTATGPARIAVSGQRVRLSGEGLGTPGCGLWALITDPRTGLLWVQGPTSETESGWTLDLVLGVDEPGANPLPYRVSLAAIPPEVHERWLSVALQGTPVALERSLPPTWLTQSFEVLVGGLPL